MALTLGLTASMRSMAASKTSCGVTCRRAISSPRLRASYSAYSLKAAMKVDSGSAERRRFCTGAPPVKVPKRHWGLIDSRVCRRYYRQASRSVTLQPMVEEPLQRRLAAILAVDVVGYTH